jgi:hypothetical protein
MGTFAAEAALVITFCTSEAVKSVEGAEGGGDVAVICLPLPQAINAIDSARTASNRINFASRIPSPV